MNPLDSSRNIPSVPSLWTEFHQSLRETDSESLDLVLNILRHNAENLDRVDVNISLPTASPAQREKIGKIISSVFRMHDDQEVQKFAWSLGFIDGNECAQDSIEQELWDSSELTVSLDQLYLLSFCTKKISFPSPLPDVIGTPEAPGELSVKIQKHLEDLQKQCEILKRRSEKESDPEKKERLTQEHEDLSKTLQERTGAYKAVKLCIQEAAKLQYFPDILSKRQEAYQRFAYRLNQGFDALKAANLECLFFENDGGIADLPKVCFTGWHTRIEAMLEGSGQKRGVMQKAHLFARDLRRSIMQGPVLRAALQHQGYHQDDINRFRMNVHYHQAVKQWAHERFSLGYSQEELGSDEMMKDFLSASFQAVVQGIMEKEYSPSALSSILIDEFKRMNHAERTALINEMLLEYREGCRQDPTLLIDPLDRQRELYEEMEQANNIENPQERLSALREVRKLFMEENIQPPFSLKTSYERLEAELRTNYPRPAFSKVSREFKNAPENKRLNALQGAFQSLRPEEKEQDLEVLIARMQESLSSVAQEKDLEQQKRYISDRAHDFEDFRINKNISLLERKIFNGRELSEFGAHLWLCSAKLLSPSHTTNAREDKPAQILRWAHEQYPSLSSAQALQKLREDPTIYPHLSKNLQDLAEVREYLDENPWIELGAPSPEEYEHYRSQDPRRIDLAKAPHWLRNYKDIVLAVVSKSGLNLKYASNELKNDRDIVLAAINQNGSALQFASERLKADRDIVLVVLRQFGSALQYINESLQADREIVRTAVSQDGSALQFASESLQADREIVRTALSQNGFAMKYTSEELKSDRQIVRTAVSKNGSALRFASEELKNDREIVRAAVSQNGLALQFASEELKADREIVRAALGNTIFSLRYANKKINDDREFMITAVSQNGLALQFASESLQADREIVRTALSQNRLALQYASKELQHEFRKQ